MNLKEAAQQALEYLEQHAIISGIPIRDALRAALAEDRSGDTGKTSDHFADAGKMVATINELETVEPVAWRYTPSERLRAVVLTSDPSQARLAADYGCEVQPLYTAPLKREPLTDWEIEVWAQKPISRIALCRAIERRIALGGEE